jgi:uncharacterized protein YjdB
MTNQAQYTAIISPSNATKKKVKWEVSNNTGQAVIDEDGLLTALAPGSVVVSASNELGNVTGEKTVDIFQI